jgi:hypothetical protein
VASAQIDEDQVGAWYTYAWSTGLENSDFGLRGGIHERNWDTGSDLDQLLLYAGASWSPQSNVTFTLGYAHITYGAFGPDRSKFREHRLYQEALVRQPTETRLSLFHRFTLEQRDVDGQDFRNRFRYLLGVNLPLNQQGLGDGAIYLSLYNELFINLERDIGNGRRVDYFDRNRTYAAIGYSLTDNLRVQFGYMHQETDNLGKGQLQVNILHRF